MRSIIGLTPTEITQTVDEIIMRFSDGSRARWWHQPECCESVTITDVNGDWNDLLNVPLLVAEKRTSKIETRFYTVLRDDYEEWTFYTFRSINGSVDVRWYGTSNGYYSTDVTFRHFITE